MTGYYAGTMRLVKRVFVFVFTRFQKFAKVVFHLKRGKCKSNDSKMLSICFVRHSFSVPDKSSRQISRILKGISISCDYRSTEIQRKPGDFVAWLSQEELVQVIEGLNEIMG